ncbi:DNA polymerase eta, partial [Tremellales sp. Uapishka_1]
MSFLSGQSKRSQPGPTIATYRHLLSPQALTPFNPLRVIAHCDIDAAYAQFEAVRLGIPDDVPLAVLQWEGLIAVNYPARKFGIRRFTKLDEAVKLCPQLRLIHVATYRQGEEESGYWEDADLKTHKVSLDPYRRESLKILAIFKEMVPRGEVEKASIDEAFLDLTPLSIERLLKLHPYLGKVPEDAPDGLDSPLPPAPPIDWRKAGNLFPIRGEGKGDEEEEQDGHEEEEIPWLWEDWMLCLGAEIMGEIREEVWKRLHYTCSAGIAHNKTMAKLCSAWKKPNKQTILRSSAIPAFLNGMAFTDIRFLGGKLGSAMATEYEAKTVGDMLSVPLEEMQRRFGDESIWVWNILRGIDHTEVKEKLATKSMLASKNVRPNVTSPEQGHHWLSVLAGELNVRLRESREAVPGLWPKTLVLSHRQGIDPSRSRQIPFPFTKNLTTDYIVKYARKLWDDATQPMKKGNMRLNNTAPQIALSFTGLERMEGGQKGIEGFFASGPAPAVQQGVKRSRSTSPPMSNQPSKTRLPPLHTSKTPAPTVLQSFLAKNGESSTSTSRKAERSTTPVIEIGDDDEVEIVKQQNGSSWTCPKCHHRFPAPPDIQDREERAKFVLDQKQEHADYHFALDLQNGSVTPVAKNPKKKKKAEGIKAFFAPREREKMKEEERKTGAK